MKTPAHTNTEAREGGGDEREEREGGREGEGWLHGRKGDIQRVSE